MTDEQNNKQHRTNEYHDDRKHVWGKTDCNKKPNKLNTQKTHGTNHARMTDADCFYRASDVHDLESLQIIDTNSIQIVNQA